MNLIKNTVTLCLFIYFVVILNHSNAQVISSGSGDPTGTTTGTVSQGPTTTDNDYFAEHPEKFLSLTESEKAFLDKLNSNRQTEYMISLKQKQASKMPPEKFTTIIEAYNYLYLEFLIQDQSTINENQGGVKCGILKNKNKLPSILTDEAKVYLNSFLKDSFKELYLFRKYKLSGEEITTFSKNLEQLLAPEE